MGIISSREPNTTDQTVQNHIDDQSSMFGSTSPSKISTWKSQQQKHHVRQPSIRSVRRTPTPMPDHNELDKRFAKVLVSLKS